MSPVILISKSTLENDIFKIRSFQEDNCLCKPDTIFVDRESSEYLINDSNNPTPFKNSVKNISITAKNDSSDEITFPLKLMKEYNLPVWYYSSYSFTPTVNYRNDIIVSLDQETLTILLEDSTFTLEFDSKNILCYGDIIENRLNENSDWLVIR